MNEKRSSIVGFALIGIILLAFSWYNTKQFEKRQKEAFVRDSLAAAAAIQSGAAVDSSALAEEIPEEIVPEDETPQYQEDFLRHRSSFRYCLSSGWIGPRSPK